jgi:hypothetical protein
VRILFFNTNSADYVSDGLFHGLRSILGEDCVDIPRHDCMYRPANPGIASQLRGHGFTFYGLLDDTPELVARRYFWESHIADFDLAVVGNIWVQWPLVWYLSRLNVRTALIDGGDSPRIFPYSRSFLSTPMIFATPISDSLYFKRELFDDRAAAMGVDRFLPAKFRRLLPAPRHLLPISCSVPEEKIRPIGQQKKKLLPRHIVDPEVAALFVDGGTEYAFSDERGYYDDLAASKFGITVKRAGWDALRHYELAAAGTIPCFRSLREKPSRCAPLGLDETNCIAYSDAPSLKRRLESISETEYQRLAAGAHSWALANTTRALAQRFLDAVTTP